MERQLVIGGFYRHFKNKLYQVKAIAYHSETKENILIYIKGTDLSRSILMALICHMSKHRKEMIVTLP